uniref:Olfactory receptor 7E24-like n=1 Tax=Castor canadensis TaxID=51338 RepID=A0A8B7TNU6_CASCN
LLGACLFISFLIFLQRCPSSIEAQNITGVSEFHLLVLSEDPGLQPILFVLFLYIYLVTLLGNMIIVLAVCSDSHLHTPMYFFLSNLSLVDICYISTTVPKMILNMQTNIGVISYGGCLTQMSLFLIFLCMDDILLTTMAYDRFVAICYPLHYSVIMNPLLCGISILLSFSISILDSQLQNLIALQFTCFKDIKISNFFCDPTQLLNLSCSLSFTARLVMYFIDTIFGFVLISGILFSYYKIVSTILTFPSSSGRYKAFSTCLSHLLVVCLFYGTGIGVYISSTVWHCPIKVVVASLMYTVITPMLNPFIYSLRNREISRTLKRLCNRTILTGDLLHQFSI